MFLEGEVNWTLVFGIMAVARHVVALIAIWFAVANRVRHVSATDQLDLVQKVAEKSDKRLFETMNAVPVAMVETDRSGKFVFANRAAHQLLGRRDAELLSLRFHSATWGITYPDGKPIPADLLPSARALRGQTVRGFQHLMVNASTRKKMLVSVTAMPIENDSGHVTGSIAAIVETEVLTTPAIEPAPLPAPEPVPTGPSLTDRVFDAAASALVVVDTAGRVLRANRTALAMLGRNEGVIDTDFADLFLAEDRRAEARQAIRAAVAAPESEPEAFEALDTHGARLHWSMLPLTEDGGATEALLLAGAVAVDPIPLVEQTVEEAAPADAEAPADAAPEIEPVADQALLDAQAAFDRRQTEMETAHAQALARIQAEAAATAEGLRGELEAERRLGNVGRLTGGVTHDFNALLGVMTSALDLMLRQADEPERVRRLGQAALAAGRRGELLTRRLTAFSRTEDQTTLQTLDLGLVLRGLEGPLRDLAGPGMDLMVEAPPAPACARIDPAAFEGAVRALVRNAAEAADGRGSVAVRLERLEDEASLRLSVRDSGPGMEADTARRASEPFFTTRAGAAGLGLSQVFAFARQSGGVLSVDSAPGEGAEVAVVLPAETVETVVEPVDKAPQTDEPILEPAS